MFYAYSFALFMLGAIVGAGFTLLVMHRFWPRVTVNHVTISPETIARGIVAGGGIHCSTPPVHVDWTLIHRIVEAEGYQLIAKHDAGAPKRH